MGTLKNNSGKALTFHRERKQLIRGHGFSAKGQDLLQIMSESSNSWLASPDRSRKARRLHGKENELGWTPTHATWQKSIFSELSYQPHGSFMHPWNREEGFKFRNSIYVAWSDNANYHSQTPVLLGWSRLTVERGSKRSESPAASKEAPDLRHVKGRGRNGGSQVLILVIDASCKLFYVPNVSPFLKRLTCTFQLCWIQETQQLCWINFKFSWRPPNVIKPLTCDYLNLI